jgi:hypothetical protein
MSGLSKTIPTTFRGIDPRSEFCRRLRLVEEDAEPRDLVPLDLDQLVEGVHRAAQGSDDALILRSCAAGEPTGSDASTSRDNTPPVAAALHFW